MTRTPDPNTRRVGLLVPSSNTVMETDFFRGLPPGWTLHASRMFLESTTVEAEGRMIDTFAMPAAKALATAYPHVIVFGCTSAGALRGNEFDNSLTMDIQNRTGVPTVSVVASVRRALRLCGSVRVAVITPYVEDLNERIRASFEADGITILRILGLGIQENFRIAHVPADAILDLARRAVTGLHPDALFVSCTNFPATGILDRLQRDFPFPVLTSNQVALEAAVASASANAGDSVIRKSGETHER